jgi:hypothetical protein
MLKNTFPHNQHMASGNSNTGNVSSESQRPSAHDGGHLSVNMVKSHIYVATQSCDYGSSKNVMGLESPPPPKNPCRLKIQNLCLIF